MRLASSEERASTAAIAPVIHSVDLPVVHAHCVRCTPGYISIDDSKTSIPKTTSFRACPGIQFLIPSWIPDQCHLAGSVTSGMTYIRFSRPMSLHVIPGLPRNPDHIPLWIPDQCHLAGSVTSGMTWPGACRPCSLRSLYARIHQRGLGNSFHHFLQLVFAVRQATPAWTPGEFPSALARHKP